MSEEKRNKTGSLLVPVEFSLFLGPGTKCRTSWEVFLGGSLCLTFKAFEDK